MKLGFDTLLWSRDCLRSEISERGMKPTEERVEEIYDEDICVLLFGFLVRLVFVCVDSEER